MNLFNFKRNLKVFLSLTGLSVNVGAQTQSPATLNKDVSHIDIQTADLTLPNRYQVVSEEELIYAIQNNKLELLLLKKGILIQRPSAESTVCLKCGTGGGD